MALNFQQFNTAGPNNKVSDIIKGIASGRPTNQEYAYLKAENEIKTSLATLYDLSNTSFEKDEDGNYTKILSAERALKKQNIPNAFESWAALTGEMSNRDKVALKRSGMNAVEYAKLYNGYKNAYMDRIERNILNTKEMGKLSGSDMRGIFENAPTLRSFINMNSVNPNVKSFVSPKRTAFDQISDFGGMLMPKADDTLGELATSVPGMIAGYGLGRGAYNKFKTGSFFGGGAASGSAGAGTGAGGAASPILGPDGNPLTKSSQSSLRKGIANLFSKAKGKAPSMKSATSLLTKHLGKARGLSMLARFGPYGALAALIGGAGLALYNSRDSYQSGIDKRMQDTYGGGPVDTSGAAGIEAARQKMADYNAKYGR
tara:strand:- start:11343 stop:12461 length:1119 start_codon:yes stop_codon:yes gene_type:complete